MKKFYKYIAVLLAFMVLSFVVLSCDTGHSPMPPEEDLFPVEGAGDYNGTISNGSKNLWVSVWINAWNKIQNDGKTEKGSFFFALFTSAEKTKANHIITVLCDEKSSYPFDVNGSQLFAVSDDYRFEAYSTAGGGESYSLTLTLKTSSGQDIYTGQLQRKAE